MSTLKTRSMFYYGHTVTTTNRCIDFKEGAGSELKATLKVGSYSLTDYVTEIQRALNEAASTLTFTVTVNRTTRLITIAATGTFTLLAATGSRHAQGIYPMAGFAATDVTGTTRTGTSASGSVYETQYLLRNYTSPEHYSVKESASVNVSAAGAVQTLYFGEGQRMKCNIICITDVINLKTNNFNSNPTGINDALAFLNYLITKAKIEFMPDLSTPAVFYKMILDSTKTDKSGVAFELSNMNVPDFYETGDLIFRKVIA